MANVAGVRLRAIAILVLLFSPAAWAAAHVAFAVGDVIAIDATGQSRSLSKGAELVEGDTVKTQDGRAQLSFSDGGYVSLQPGSEFRIEEYRFEGRNDGSERGIFSLIKGGLRTITGLLGRNNRNSYRLRTPIATIGIRGTEYTATYLETLAGTVGEGEIEVCSSAGCLNVTSGESYAVTGEDVLPTVTGMRTDLPAPPPVFASQPQFVSGDALVCPMANSTSCKRLPGLIPLIPPPSPPPVVVPTSTLIPTSVQQSFRIR
jgi:hypothetical protein